MRFENPLIFSTLIFYFICEKFCRKREIALYFPHFYFLRTFINKEKILKFLILFFAVLSASNPYIPKEIEYYNKGDSIVLSIDSSGSMADNKFELVKKVAIKFINNREKDKIGVVIFGTETLIATPLIKDKKFISSILEKTYVGIAGENTALLDSIIQSIRLLKESKSKTKIIILLTDGIDNSSKVSLEDVIKEIKKYNIKVYTIGIGDGVNYKLLRYISKISGAKSYEVYSTRYLWYIYKEIDKLEKSKLKHSLFYKEYLFYYPLFITILLFIFYLWRKKW